MLPCTRAYRSKELIQVYILFLTVGSLQQEMYRQIVERPETLTIWIAFCYIAGSISHDTIKGTPNQLLIWTPLLIMAYSGLLNLSRPIDVGIFQCNKDSLILCREYLNVVTFKIPVLLWKRTEFSIYGMPFCVIIYRSYKLVNTVQFFGSPCTCELWKEYFGINFNF